MSMRLFLQDCGVVTPLGCGKQVVASKLFSGSSQGISQRDDLVPGKTVLVGVVDEHLPALPEALTFLDCRNNRLMQLALQEIAPSVLQAAARYGKDRIAVVLGTSTSGIAKGEEAYAGFVKAGKWPNNYHYHQQELSSLSRFASGFFGLTGPTYTIATACSSSAKVFASARRLIEAGIVDAAVVGGADTLCRLTLRGFTALEIVSPERCNPFSVNRNGITIGEGAAAFLLSREEGPVQLLGVGETSDAYHLTAPDPEGNGARDAMLQALLNANVNPADIDYINLHGTATPFNDAMESRAVTAVFGDRILCSSTKAMTGHMLGAAGGCEAAFLWLTLNPATNSGLLPPHLWDGQVDPALPSLEFVRPGTTLPSKKSLAMLSNSFGFGGSNVSLILGRTAA